MNNLKNLSKLMKQAPKAVPEEPVIELNQELVGEKQFLKKEKYYQQDGPMLYVSKMLQRKGPLTYQQIWAEFVRDKSKPTDDLLLSKTHLKQKVMRKMREEGRIQKVGYDKKRKVFLGFRVVPDIAFKNTHPDELLSLNPPLSIGRMQDPDVLYRKAILMDSKQLPEE